MALWKIIAKNNWNWGVKKQLVKGVFIEMSTSKTTSPLGIVKYQEMIAMSFNVKYSTCFDGLKMNSSYFVCEKIS